MHNFELEDAKICIQYGHHYHNKNYCITSFIILNLNILECVSNMATIIDFLVFLYNIMHNFELLATF
jgi:hypothetical protein